MCNGHRPTTIKTNAGPVTAQRPKLHGHTAGSLAGCRVDGAHGRRYWAVISRRDSAACAGRNGRGRGGNARLFEQARMWQRWLEALSEIRAELLAGASTEDALTASAGHVEPAFAPV